MNDDLKAPWWFKLILIGNVILMLVLSAVVASAAPPCNVRSNRVIVKQAFVPAAVQAVTVNRVAVPAFYSYGVNGHQQPQASSMDYAELMARFDRLERMLAEGGAVRTSAVDPLRLVRQTCAKCHSGPDAKGGFRVDGELSNEDRLLAVEMILHDDPAKRMPKGAALSADQIGLLIQALSKRPAGGAVRASDVPPPPPTPEEN